MPTHTGGETDLRFVYCAGKKIISKDILVSCLSELWFNYVVFTSSAAISSMLKNWTGMDCEKAKEYIRSCQVLYHTSQLGPSNLV